MAENTVIGAGTFLRGVIRGEGNVAIEGHVEGDVSVAGTVTIQPSALVKAIVRGTQIVVRGAVAGDLYGEQTILLEDGARVVGNIHAPRIGISEGALVRGRVETSSESAVAPPVAVSRVAEVRPAVTRSAPAVFSAPMPARRDPPAATPAAAIPMAPPVLREQPVVAPVKVPPARSSQPPLAEGMARTAPSSSLPASATASAFGAKPALNRDVKELPKRAPLPQIPALKKGTPATMKKKSGA